MFSNWITHSLNGKDTEQTKKVRIFADSLKVLNISIFFQDERLTSVSAKIIDRAEYQNWLHKEKIEKECFNFSSTVY